VLAQLGEMSLSTVHRLSADWQRDIPRRLPRGGPERANQVLREVPMKRLAWDESVPGHFEVDWCITVGRVPRAITCTPCK